MKLIKMLTIGCLMLPLLAQSAEVQVETIGMDAKDRSAGYQHPVIKELQMYDRQKLMNGSCDNTLYCSKKDKIDVVVINTSDKSIDYNEPNLVNRIKQSDWTVLIGDYSANRDASFELLGYAVPQAIVAIKNPGERGGKELFTFKYNKNTANSKIARKMIDYFLE